MARFTTRVELHGASSDDYERLHRAMEAGGFSRQITGDNGKTYRLPTAEYAFEHATMTTSDVCNKASAIAETIKRAPAVFVTTGSCAWLGLTSG